MSSDEIDSTTFSQQIGVRETEIVAPQGSDSACLPVGEATTTNSAEVSAGSASPTGQKRKLSDDCSNAEAEAIVQNENKKAKAEATASSSGQSADASNGGLQNHGNNVAAAAAANEAGSVVKQEPPDDEATAAACSSSTSAAVTVKVEPGSSSVKVEPNEQQDNAKAEAETEETAVKEEATSSLRDSCQYGIRCYRDENVPTQSKKQWTSRDIRKMLQMVEERPVIWQVDYSDRTSRPNAFLEIEKVLGFPALEIKRKLHNMRCTFRNQFKSYVFNNRPVKWKYYEAMKFMYKSALSADAMDPWEDDVPTANHTFVAPVDVPWKKRIRDRTHSKSSKTTIIPNETNKRLNFIGDEIDNQSLIDLKQQQLLQLQHQQFEPMILTCNNNEKTVENAFSDFQFQQPAALPPLQQHMQQQPQPSLKEENSIFGDYVAESIRNLPDDLRELAKRQITHLLSDLTAHTRDTTTSITTTNSAGTTIVLDSCSNGLETSSIGSGEMIVDPASNVIYSIYDLNPQAAAAVLSEPHEIQLKLHEF